MKQTTRIANALEAHHRTLASLLSVLLFANVFVVVHDAAVSDPGARFARDGSLVSGDANDPVVRGPRARGGGAARNGNVASGARGVPSPVQTIKTAPPGTVIEGLGRVPHGIDGNSLKVVYYWKGDQTKSSQFLQGSGQEGNVDEGEAFTNLIEWINRHPTGELMGFPYDMHGWKLSPQVIDAGKGDDQIRAAERIASEIKPFAAVSSHGSISAYVCPRLAKAGIFNVSTYDLDWGLYERTDGYCLPQGIAWGAQVDLSIAYLAAQASREPERVYGFLYAEYPGLVDSAPKVAQMLRDAGVPIPDGAVQSVSADLTTAGRQQPGVVAKFFGAGVNTIIAPDSGSLITFTHAAQAANYHPDYYVWPCSGEDSTGMVRLYNAAQWANASGLTCYDRHLNSDLTNDDIARQTEWYKAYQEVDPGAEPPAPTALVYQSLLPLVAGITHAGRALTVERFNEGMQIVRPYRYDAITGRTTNPANILVTLSAADGSQVGDAGKVYWDPNRTSPGNATPGVYVYSDRRYRRGAAF